MTNQRKLTSLSFLLSLAALSSGCSAPTQAQNPTQNPTQNPPQNSTAANATEKDDRVAQVTVEEIDAPKGELRRRGFAIDAPAQIEPLAPSFPVPPSAIRVRAGDDLKAAIARAPDGATVIIGEGTYRVGDINVNGRRLTIQNAPGEKVWLDGTEKVSGWNEENGVWVAPWNTWFGRGKNIDDPYLDKANFPLAAEREMVFADGVALFQVGSREAVGPGQFFADKAKNQLVIGVDPNGREIEATKWEKGIGFYANGGILRGVGFKGYADWGFHGQGDGITLESCTFAWNAQAGFKFSKNEGTPILVKGNLALGNGRKGGDLIRTKGAKIIGNRFSFNNVEGFRIQWDAAGVKVLEAAEIDMRENVADNNNSMGLWLDVDCDNSTMNDNIAFRNRAVGLHFEVSKGAVIENNQAYENGTGIQVANASGARVSRNQLWNNTQGLVVKWTKRKTLNPGDGDAIYETRDNTFQNNLVALSKPRKDAVLIDMSHVQGRPATEFVDARNNTYVLGQGVSNTPFLWSVQGGWNKAWNDLEALQTQTGAENGSRLLREATIKTPEKDGIQSLEIAGVTR